MIFEAIAFATRAHSGDYRKGTRIPYIIHPLHVAKILIESECPEHVVAAGILHDTLEDTRVTFAEIEATWPELALRWARERGDASAAYADSVGIKLTVPFGSSARLRQETAGALAQAAHAVAELVLTQQRLGLELARAQREAHTAQRQVDHAQARKALTDDTLRLSEKAFALGETDVASLLRARAAALESQALLARQQTARAASVSRLKQSMGVLP